MNFLLFVICTGMELASGEGKSYTSLAEEVKAGSSFPSIELLPGFFDVIAESLLTVFGFQELELMICGVPKIKLEDWKQHAEHSGKHSDTEAECPNCQWFWEIVVNFDQEMKSLKSRLLQFVTGTCGVSSRKALGCHKAMIETRGKFTIHGIPVVTCLFPQAQSNQHHMQQMHEATCACSHCSCCVQLFSLSMCLITSTSTHQCAGPRSTMCGTSLDTE